MLSCFSIFFSDCQHTITISHALLTNNILIGFDYPLFNLKHVTFLIILLLNTSRSFPFCLKAGLVFPVSIPGMVYVFQ